MKAVHEKDKKKDTLVSVLEGSLVKTPEGRPT
jgi:hypothetical protein